MSPVWVSALWTVASPARELPIGFTRSNNVIRALPGGNNGLRLEVKPPAVALIRLRAPKPK